MRDPNQDKVVFNKQVYDHVRSKFGFKCIYFNADSLLNKIAELETLVAEQDPDICNSHNRNTTKKLWRPCSRIRAEHQWI